jgi:subtilisin-like proprotein convertase family protein
MRALTIALIGLIALTAGSPALAQSNYNTRYGDVRINQLPRGGMTSHIPWVGSWWDYTRDGIAYRWTTKKSVDAWKKDAGRFGDHAEADAKAKLSPAEKFDHFMGRQDQIDTAALEAYLGKVTELSPTINPKMEERQTLVRKLNALIAEHSGESGWSWKETEVGKQYVALSKEIDDAQAELAEIAKDWKIDTATEFEVMHHGNGQFALGDWWGHCNAWAAAAIMEPEPRHAVTAGGIEFSAADVKALLTEAWMEAHSSFFGSRNDWDGDEDARGKVDFKDLTPASFHVFFADQIGNKDKAFVIDRYTGSQVWNQPVFAYRSHVTPVYTVGDDGKAKADDVDVMLTKYNSQGVGREQSEGTQAVYPIQIRTTFWWMTDGLPHDALTVSNIDNSLSDKDFEDWYKIKSRYDDQVHIRTVNYVLWLDKPLDDPDARIIGDGKWEHGDAANYNHSHPDFLWQPLENMNNPSRDYENELVAYSKLEKDILPGSVEAHAVPDAPSDALASTDVPKDIPDNAPSGPALSTLTVSDDRVIHSLAVKVKITHPYVGDLQLELLGPGSADSAKGCDARQTPSCDGCACETCVCGQDDYCCKTAWDDVCVKQCNDDCGGCGASGTKSAVLKKKGVGGSEDDIDRTFDVKDWNGASAKGTWTLKVSDHAGDDKGALQSWSLEIK